MSSVATSIVHGHVRSVSYDAETCPSVPLGRRSMLVLAAPLYWSRRLCLAYEKSIVFHPKHVPKEPNFPLLYDSYKVICQ